MKLFQSILFISTVLLSLKANSQDFYFNNKETTLIKSVNQTPAHWYIEIYSNLSIEKTLKWKAIFDNIPNEWTVNFDDQTQNHLPVHHGDESNFTLFYGLDFPQKLIIGADFNGVALNGTISFEISDPATNDKDTIHFHFIVNPLSVEFLEDNQVFRIEKQVIKVMNHKNTTLNIVDSQGRVVQQMQAIDEFDLSLLTKGVLYFVQLIQSDDSYLFKLINE